jgi:hypothetical protein
MKTILRRIRPSPAMVIACIALAVALGGTSVAAIQALPKNSVGTKQLKKNAVVSAKVKNRSLLAVDFKAGQLPAGPKGDKGDPGAPGAPNPNADKLDGYDANGLIRTALGAGPAFPDSVPLGSCGSAETQVAALTIVAPGAGYVDVSGAVTTRNLGTGGTVRAHLFPSAGVLSSYEYAVTGTSGSALQVLSSHWVYPVTAGSFTVQLRACSFATGADAFGGQLRAVYAPFGATGAGLGGMPSRVQPNSPADPAG